MLLHHAPPRIPPEQLASGSRRVSRQSCSPVGPAEYPARAARQWIRRVSRQSGSPVDPAEYPARGGKLILPSIPPERLASGSRRVSCQTKTRPVSRQSCSPVDRAGVSRQSSPPVNPAVYPRVARQWIPPSIPLSIPCRQDPASIDPERLASIRQWIPPVSRQSSSPVWFCSMSKRADGNLGVEVSRMRRNLL